MKQKVIPGGMCRGGDIRDIQLFRRKEKRGAQWGEGTKLLSLADEPRFFPGLLLLFGLRNHFSFINLS